MWPQNMGKIIIIGGVMNIGMIADTIKELGKEGTTFAMCKKLASLYIVRDHFFR